MTFPVAGPGVQRHSARPPRSCTWDLAEAVPTFTGLSVPCQGRTMAVHPGELGIRGSWAQQLSSRGVSHGLRNGHRNKAQARFGAPCCRPTRDTSGSQARACRTRRTVVEGPHTNARDTHACSGWRLGGKSSVSVISGPESGSVPTGRVAMPAAARDARQQDLHGRSWLSPPGRVDPGIAEAVEPQTRAMRELSRRAFPEPEVSSDDQPAPIEAGRFLRRREAEATRALALRRARAERAARQAGTAAAVPQSADLRATA